MTPESFDDVEPTDQRRKHISTYTLKFTFKIESETLNLKIKH